MTLFVLKLLNMLYACFVMNFIIYIARGSTTLWKSKVIYSWALILNGSLLNFSGSSSVGVFIYSSTSSEFVKLKCNLKYSDFQCLYCLTKLTISEILVTISSGRTSILSSRLIFSIFEGDLDL